MGDDTKNFILNYKKLSNLKFIITQDEEELQREWNEENENELKEIEERLNIIKNKIEIENKERVINLKESFKNSIFILNKIDTITTIEKQKQSFNNFREYIKNNFKVNLVKDKNSIGISAKKNGIIII